MDIGERAALFPTVMRRVQCFKERKNRRSALTDPISGHVDSHPGAAAQCFPRTG